MHYVELHCHSNYSFKEGASSVEELLMIAKNLEYPALGLTDHDNLCGAMEFSRVANSIGVKPITGAEITMEDGSHITLLVKNRSGYSNLCNLITYSRVGSDTHRLRPRLSWKFFEEHANGLILLTGCSKGNIPKLIVDGRSTDAEIELRKYLDWFGGRNVFVELQQNRVYGDTLRNRGLVSLAQENNVGVVATNNVHYHVRDRHQLHDALVSIKNNKTLETSHIERRPNANFYLKSSYEMSQLFKHYPKAIDNTVAIADRCVFNLKEDLGYKLPDYRVPHGYTTQSYLEYICTKAAVRKYGDRQDIVKERLREEFRLIELHGLAGFFLIYYDIIQIARQVMIDLGLNDVETPLEVRPPGRGRGSSVAMLVGYLIGLSHIDPLQYDLSLGRVINDEMGKTIDIDLDFPRNIREELIKRIHEKYGWDHALITGAISSYKIKGCIKDLGKVLGLPDADLSQLAKQADVYHSRNLREEADRLPNLHDKITMQVWGNLFNLADQLLGFPKYLSQHSGGMIIGSSPLIDLVPAQPGAIDHRYICHWDKDSIADAGFVKIDCLGLGALSQMQEMFQLIEKHKHTSIDISRINFNDKAVYKSIHTGDTIGVFQIESPAQMQNVG